MNEWKPKFIKVGSVEEALDKFASMSEENRLTIEESKRLIKGQGYVRTKNRIYKLADFKDGKALALVWRGYELIYIKESSILKKADSADELCDEFVCENSLINSSPKKENGQTVDRYSKIDNARMLARKGLTVYGAIWTEKGLIYATVLRDDGGRSEVL